jgi:hypothetical protein
VAPYGYVRRTYGVDPVIGARVRHTELKGPGAFGTIAKPGLAGHYVYVRFDGKKHADPCHPTALDYSPQEAADA